MALFQYYQYPDLIAILPPIVGNFSPVAPPPAFEEKMRGQCFWSFNENNTDLYFSFGSPKYYTKHCFHILNGVPRDFQLNISWKSSQGAFVASDSDGYESYLTPVGWHQGIFLMKNDYLKRYEVLITEKREAECRANHNIVYEAIEIIRKQQDFIRDRQIPSTDEKKRFWLLVIIIELILFTITGLSFQLISDYPTIFAIIIVIVSTVILMTPYIAVVKYKVLKAKARSDFFDRI